MILFWTYELSSLLFEFLIFKSWNCPVRLTLIPSFTFDIVFVWNDLSLCWTFLYILDIERYLFCLSFRFSFRILTTLVIFRSTLVEADPFSTEFLEPTTLFSKLAWPAFPMLNALTAFLLLAKFSQLVTSWDLDSRLFWSCFKAKFRLPCFSHASARMFSVSNRLILFKRWISAVDLVIFVFLNKFEARHLPFYQCYDPEEISLIIYFLQHAY